MLCIQQGLGYALHPRCPSPPTPHLAHSLQSIPRPSLEFGNQAPSRRKPKALVLLRAWNPKFQNILSLHCWSKQVTKPALT